jgi:hypothetical protein
MPRAPLRNLSLIAVLLSLGAGGTSRAPMPRPLVVANDNRTSAGTVRDGVMTVELDVVMAR